MHDRAGVGGRHGAARPRLSLVLPTIDERRNVEELVPALLSDVEALAEIIVVDDGSTDGTRQLVRALAERDPRVRLIERAGERCLTSALQAGIDAASGELVGWMDADQAMPPRDLARLVDAIEAGADVAVGSRFAAGGGIKGQVATGFFGRVSALANLGTSEDSWLGVALSWGLNALVLPAILGDGVHDYTSGFLVARRPVLDGLRLRGDHGEYFIDLWMRARARGLAVIEVGYRGEARRHGRSKTASTLPDYVRRGRRYLRAAIDARSRSSG